MSSVSGVDMFSLKGKRALVTGATGHLGRSIVSALAEAGAQVLVNSRSDGDCQELVGHLESRGLNAEAARFDVTDESEVKAFFARQEGAPLHILVSNAYAGTSGSVASVGGSDYNDAYEATVVATQRLFVEALPCLRLAVEEAGDASVINIASMYALVSPDLGLYDSTASANPPQYGAAKAALLQWTRYAACEFAPEGIRVNAISPGPFPSREVQEARPEFVSRLRQRVPLGRVGVADELKAPSLFLASPAASFVTGSNLVVDGAWTCW